MSRQVLFNGAVLVRPGAATKIDASGFTSVALGGVGIVGIVGEADDGAPNIIKTFRNSKSVMDYYGSGPLVEAGQIAFQPGNDAARIPGGATLLVAVKVNQSTQATLDLQGTGLANVAGVTVTPQGTPATTAYTYKVVALFNGGFTLPVAANTTTGAATLNNTNFNRVGWTTLVGAQGYQIFRTASAGTPATTGYIGSALAGAVSFDDTGLAAAASPTLPTVNSTTVSIHLTSKNWGVNSNNVSAQVLAGVGVGKIINLQKFAGGVVSTETSPSLGGSAKFTLLYTGAGSPATATITQNGVNASLTTSCTGATADNLNLDLSVFNSLADLIVAINATGKYTATALIGNSGFFDPTDLDPVTGVSILTTAGSFYAAKFDIVTWINANSSLVTAVYGPALGPPTTMGAAAFLTGGYRGVTSNTNFVNGLSMLGSIRVNQVVALASTDGTVTEIENGSPVSDSYTALSVAAAVAAHCDYYSSTQGKSERQGWIGLHLTKAAGITEANLINDFNVVMVLQQNLLPTAAPNFQPATPAGTFLYMPEWATAVGMAGMRAGAPLGEPLTWKYIRSYGLQNTSDWTVANDAVDLLLNGISVLENVPGKGIRIMRCLTTYTRSDNDAYTEESVVQAWKDIAYVWRTAIEDRYTGTKGILSNIKTVVPYSIVILTKLRDEQGEIADSFINGQVVPGFRDLDVQLDGDVISLSGTVSPVEGINFELLTIFVVPAQIQT